MLGGDGFSPDLDILPLLFLNLQMCRLARDQGGHNRFAFAR